MHCCDESRLESRRRASLRAHAAPRPHLGSADPLRVRGRTLVALLAAVLAAGVTATTARAADLSLRVVADRTQVTLDDQIQLDVVVEGRARSLEEPQRPPLADFDVYSRGQSQSIQIVNGAMSASNVFSYVLAPKKEGTFTIGPFVLALGGREYRSNTLTVTVGGAGRGGGGVAPGAGGAAPGGGGTGGDSGTSSEREDRDLFVVARVDKQDAYVNEQIIYTFYLYRAVQISNVSYSQPSFQGFWVEKLKDSEKQSYKVLNGRRYLVTELSAAIFPATSGTLTIDPASLQLMVLTSPYGFSLFERGVERVLRTRPVAVHVSPLPPAGKPAIFDGAVGEGLTLAAKLERDAVEAGEPVTLSMRVEGTGNVKTFSKPRLPDLSAFRTYDGNSKTDTDANDRISGSRTYEVVLVPNDEGEHKIEPIRLAYFDTREGRYRTLETKPLPLTVVRSTHPVRTLAGDEPPPQRDIRILGQDIAHIRTDVPLTDALTPLYARGLFLALLPVPLLAVLVVGLRQRRRDLLASDVALARSTRARKVARRHLAVAGKSLEAGRGEAFYAEVSRALRQYTGDKLNVSAVGLTHDVLRERLAAAGVEAPTCERLVALLERCDAARFAPGSYGGERLREVLVEAEALLVELEGSWGRRAARAAATGPALPVLLALGLGLASAASPARAQVAPGALPSPDLAASALPPSESVPPGELLRRGHAAYEAGRFAEAIDLYSRAERAGVRNGALYFDLGNAYYKNGEVGRALASYRRAERLLPRDALVRQNLDFVLSRREDKPVQRLDPWLVTMGRRAFRLSSLNETAAAAAALYLLTCLLGLGRLLRFGRATVLRLGLYICAGLLVLATSTLALKAHAERGVQRGVVATAKVAVMSGPGQDYTTEFSLHEGTEVQIEERRAGWTRVSLGGKLRGWVPATTLAPI